MTFLHPLNCWRLPELFTKSQANAGATKISYISPRKICFSANTGSIQVFQCSGRSRTMFVLLLKSILERNGSTTRCLLIFGAAFLFAHGLDAGVYKRTRDGKTLVWNNLPSDDDVAIWSGKRDANEYATGAGTLTWYKTEKGFQTGSMLPGRGPAVVVTSYSGTMVRGKLTGSVISVDPDGKRTEFTFANGAKTGSRPPEPEPSPYPVHNQRLYAVTMAPAEGPEASATVKEPAKKKASKEKKAESPKVTSPSTATPSKDEKVESAKESPAPVTKLQPSTEPQKPTIEIASIRSTPPPAPPTSEAMESAVKDRMTSDFKDETQAVFAQVDSATEHFRSAERLESVAKLPPGISESVSALTQRARDFRAKVGYETALRDFQTETETVDALSAIDQVTRNIAANDAASANAKVADFLKSNPEPSAESQAPLWLYLKSIQQLCSRSEREASVHLQRGESLAAASRTSEAIREYQEAYRIFPNPATAEKIRQLQANSLGL